MKPKFETTFFFFLNPGHKIHNGLKRGQHFFPIRHVYRLNLKKILIKNHSTFNYIESGHNPNKIQLGFTV